MPVLKNKRQEAFAHGLAQGKSQVQAYKDAGYKPSESAPTRLAEDVRVCERVAELESMIVGTVVLDRAYAITRMDELSREAQRTGDLKAAIVAHGEVAKMLGAYVEEESNRTRLPPTRRHDDPVVLAAEVKVLREVNHVEEAN